MSTTRLRLNPLYPVGLLIMSVMLLALGLPGATPTLAAGNGEDYATNELGNPWDMDGRGDIAFEQTRDGGHMSNIAFTNGIFSATATGGDPELFLRWPVDSHVNPVPQDGNYHPIDANKYKFFTVKVNVPSTQFAQVVWQVNADSPPKVGSTGFKQLQAGWNIVTFDLTSGTSGTPWSGSIQGLRFDPMNANGVFQIDYVRLSTVDPSSPDNIPPQLAITSPSFISGPDYATTVVGNSWDMDDAADLKGLNVTGASFSNSVYNATNTSGDPALMLHVTTPIDTSRFKYATYRMLVDGQKDTTLGSVARFLWWTTIPEQATISNDNVVYELYQTVSFDLTKIKLEAGATWANSTPIVFRLDPHEFPTAHTFHLDYVMLTGDTTAGNSFNIRYLSSDGDGPAPNPQFFFDNNASGFDGTAIACTQNTASVAAGAGFKVFLPPIRHDGQSPPVSPAGSTCTWNTSNVPNGTYYIYGVVDDGTDTAKTYSQTPVVVSH